MSSSGRNAVDSYQKPEQLQDIKALKAGDVLLFRSPFTNLKPTSISDEVVVGVIKLSGSLFSRVKHGHYDTTHAAICIGHLRFSGIPVIAHITGHEFMSYRQETLKDMLDRDGGDRAFLVYRPTSVAQAESITELAANAPDTIKWKISAAAMIYLKSAKLAPDREQDEAQKEFSEQSFCSKFVVEVIKNSEKLLARPANENINMRSDSTPKAIEGTLYDNPHFRLLLYPGNNLYQGIKGVVETELTRLDHKSILVGKSYIKDKFSEKKSHAAQRSMMILEKNFADEEVSDLEKSILLLQCVLPILNSSETGFSEKSLGTESYANIMAYARARGIFDRDIKNYDATRSSAATSSSLSSSSDESSSSFADYTKKADLKKSYNQCLICIHNAASVPNLCEALVEWAEIAHRYQDSKTAIDKQYVAHRTLVKSTIYEFIFHLRNLESIEEVSEAIQGIHANIEGNKNKSYQSAFVIAEMKALLSAAFNKLKIFSEGTALNRSSLTIGKK
jgi:hypothetical protein